MLQIYVLLFELLTISLHPTSAFEAALQFWGWMNLCFQITFIVTSIYRESSEPVALCSIMTCGIWVCANFWALVILPITYALDAAEQTMQTKALAYGVFLVLVCFAVVVGAMVLRIVVKT